MDVAEFFEFDELTLQVLRSTGEYQDYTGIGYFGAESERTLEEKGMLDYTLVGQTASHSSR